MNESKADTVIKACELNRKGQAKYFFSRTPTRGATNTHIGKDTNTQADMQAGRQAGRQTDTHASCSTSGAMRGRLMYHVRFSLGLLSR